MELFEVGDERVVGAGIVDLLHHSQVIAEALALLFVLGAAFED